MRTISIVTAGIFILISTIVAIAQDNRVETISSIEPYSLSISYAKTTNLVFPCPIKSVDRGSQDILAQKAKGVENILQIKAARESFEQTNLTVITAEGKLYSFVLDYALQPSVLNMTLGAHTETTHEGLLSADSPDLIAIKSYADVSMRERKKLHRIKDKSYGIKLKLNGLTISDNVMYYRFRVFNRSNINYDIAQFRFFILDKKRARRTASQEIEVTPLHIANDTTTIEASGRRTMVFAVPKFTIPDKKHFVIQLMENNGGRNLELHITNKTVLKAKPLR